MQTQENGSKGRKDQAQKWRGGHDGAEGERDALPKKGGRLAQSGLATDTKAATALVRPLSGQGTAPGTAGVGSGDKGHLVSGRKKPAAYDAAVSNPSKAQFEQPEPSSASRALQQAQF